MLIYCAFYLFFVSVISAVNGDFFQPVELQLFNLTINVNYQPPATIERAEFNPIRHDWLSSAVFDFAVFGLVFI